MYLLIQTWLRTAKGLLVDGLLWHCMPLWVVEFSSSLLASVRRIAHDVCAQVRIVKEDGAVGLFRGAGPTVVRAMALNMGMLASNDQVSTTPGTLSGLEDLAYIFKICTVILNLPCLLRGDVEVSTWQGPHA